uniref:Uncharacterized protein n=1 Tax=Podarcis muralis TaxID=64176 RepID=A0A670HR14_PODMU
NFFLEVKLFFSCPLILRQKYPVASEGGREEKKAWQLKGRSRQQSKTREIVRRPCRVGKGRHCCSPALGPSATCTPKRSTFTIQKMYANRNTHFQV